ncbi:MAG: hypothetical protein MZV63_47650 [Marinilabiliales bacterium]|nr:hypothetical protein [Marinilabiliales bacterium]
MLRSLVERISLHRRQRLHCPQESLAGIDGIGLSLTPSNDMIYPSLSVRYSDRSGAAGPDHTGKCTCEVRPSIRAREHHAALKLLLEGEARCRPGRQTLLFP